MFRTSEAEAAKRVAATLGDIEEQRQEETRTVWGKHSRTLAMRRATCRPVMPSQIQGLDNHHAYMKWRNYVIELQLPIYDLPKHTLGFVQRPMPPLPTRPTQPVITVTELPPDNGPIIELTPGDPLVELTPNDQLEFR